jgi:O-methyltransferase
MGIAERFRQEIDRWKEHPRRGDLLYMLGAPVRRKARQRELEKARRRLLSPPIDTTNMEVLADPAFRLSAAEARPHTLLDVGRLANLWTMTRMVGEGSFVEVGTYRGGGALHILNAMHDRSQPFWCFDPFEDGGFEKITQDDKLFTCDDFTDTRHDKVVRLLARFPNATVVKGFFPAATVGIPIPPVAFCHLDVDVYEATRESLEFLAPRMARRSLIVLDDVHRNVRGVDRAIAEFISAHPQFLFLPVFPCQGVILAKNLWP